MDFDFEQADNNNDNNKIGVKIGFIPPSYFLFIFFLSGIWYSDVFSDYKTFFFYGVSLVNA